MSTKPDYQEKLYIKKCLKTHLHYKQKANRYSPQTIGESLGRKTMVYEIFKEVRKEFEAEQLIAEQKRDERIELLSKIT